MGRSGRLNRGQPLLKNGESVSITSVCTGTLACLAIRPTLATKGLSGKRVGRVPSGKSRKTPPACKCATDSLTICRDESLRTYRASLDPEPRNTFFIKADFIT